jgi:cyclohexanecarboxylate-CoA ligase
VTDAERVAGGLQARGIAPGDVVAVQLPGTYEGAVTQAAVALCGAVLLPIVTIYGPRELEFILRQSGAVALVVPHTFRGRDHAEMARSLAGLPQLRLVVVVGGPAAPDAMVSFADLARALARPYRRPRVIPDDRALLVYTSGTTAEPKGVQHSHRSLIAEVMSSVMRERGADARHLAMFPPGHVAGLLGLMRLLVHGIPAVVMESWDPARAARLIDEHRITYTVGAPVMLAGLLAEKERGTSRLGTLREFMVGAAAVPPSLITQADAAGINAYRCYGSSEHPTVSTGSRADPLVKRANTDGALIAGNEVRLIGADGHDVPELTEGEVVSRGPELFTGYTDATLNRAAFLPGRWFRTGDLGRLDEDGYLTITDRLKDIIIRGGENISAKEVEDLLAEHPAVAEAAVIAVPDPALGERVCAVVVTRPGHTFDLEQARVHFARGGVARQKTPEKLVIADGLPRTPAGKVQKYLLREQQSDGGQETIRT